MKTIGIIGGMSWESTVTYYQLLNRIARERLGGLHSAEIILWSVDFAAIEALQSRGDWESATDRLVTIARRLESAGAECLVIATNTMHRMADAVQAALSIPLLHIADATGEAAQHAGCHAPLLLATRYTMEQTFYTGRLREQFDLAVRVPDEEGRRQVHDIIYDELCQGVIRDTSRQAYQRIIASAVQEGADSVILGCTEVGLLIDAGDVPVPCLDTTALHAAAIMDYVLA